MLLVLAEELHFGRAAGRLYISQPALSRQIRRLEELMGVALLERSTRRVELTAAGEALLPRVRAVVEATDRLREAVRERSRTLTGRVVLGCYVTALPVLTALGERLREHHPGLELDLREVDFVEQTDALFDGRVDAVLAYAPMPPGIQTLPLATERQVVCLWEGHPLAGRPSVSYGELAGLPVVGSSPRVARVWRDFWAADPRPDGAPVGYTAHRATTFEAGISAVAQGLGVRFVSASCRALFPRPGIAYVDVSDAPPCTAVLAWSSARRDTPEVAVLRRAVGGMVGVGGTDPNPHWWHTGHTESKGD
ncbi:LysR family transcriptional regulator [Streptomyces ficellus]|uniref:LysR family transcriptional regulator n=1 Tax=Streptomyces ficellus TaxID=1977088 RepID=A0A6I6FHT7_9ACTN|nr:LysR family transcriptional regulator [Streptomyces ficellus]